MSLPGGYSSGVRGVFGSGFTIFSTLPLRTPRMVRLWLSTATTRYFSSKSSPLVVFISGLDAKTVGVDSCFLGDGEPLHPSRPKPWAPTWTERAHQRPRIACGPATIVFRNSELQLAPIIVNRML
jgi:hypothetical protein